VVGISGRVKRLFWDVHSRGWDEIRADPEAQAHIIEVVQQLSGVLPSGGAVIDLGCGPGHHAVALAERGFAVTAVDYSPRMLERARAKTPKRSLQITFIRADLSLDVPVPRGPFDGAICVGPVGLIASPGSFLARVHDRLRPGGHLLVEGVLAGSALPRNDTYLPPWDRAVNRLKLLVARTPGGLRRFQAGELSSLVEPAGFSVLDARPYRATVTVLGRR